MKWKIIKIYILIILLAFIVINYGQKKVELFPGNLNIQPYAANTLEPNLGFIFKINSNELILNIGNSLDIVHFHRRNSTISIGADLFTWTLLRKEDNFHFPVDAVDYLFGINFGYKRSICNFTYGLRGRISHISAHFVDGHFDAVNSFWRDGLNPKVYSREFIELNPFFKYRNLRVYAGFTYLFHVDPSSIKKDNYQIGFDYFFINHFSRCITPFIGYDLKIVHINEYTGNNSLTVGVKFGKADGKGLSLQYHYYSGNSIHGEYFDYFEKYSSIGINLDL